MQYVYTLSEGEVKMVSGGNIGPDIRGTVWAMSGIAVGVTLRFAIDNYAPIDIKQKVGYVVDSFLYYAYKLEQLQIIKTVFFPYFLLIYETATASCSLTFSYGKNKEL